jgi:competence protein ComEC
MRHVRATMTIRTLALCLAAGILWADAGRAGIRPSLGLARALIEAVAAVLAAVVGIASVAHFTRRHFTNGPFTGLANRLPAFRRGTMLLPCLGYLVSGWVAFDAGHARLDARLVEAARDRRLAEAAVPGDVYVIEAWVTARRPGSWGDEVELSRVRAVDRQKTLPGRLILRLPENRQEGAASGRESRAQVHLWPGRRVRLGVRISPIRELRNPGSAGRERAAARRGIAAQARLVDPDWIVLQETRESSGPRLFKGWARARARLRREIGSGLAAAGDRGGLVRALALGDRGALSAGVVEDFRILGLSHLLAVSGLHIGMVAGVLGWLSLRGLARVWPGLIDPFPWVFGFAAIGTGFYAWLAGGSASVERAFGGLLILGLLALARRGPRPSELLAAIALVLWSMNPAMLFDLGAELSFAACGGLIAAGIWTGSIGGPASKLSKRSASGRLGAFRSWIFEGTGSTLRVSMAAGFGTSIVLANHGLQSVLLGPLANAIAVPWAAVIVLPASLLAALGVALQMLAARFDENFPMIEAIPGFAGLLWPAQGLVDLAAWGSARSPGLPGPELGSVALTTVAALAGLACLRTGWWKGAALCWVSIMTLGGTPRADHEVFARMPRAWFFDVGQGDAALIEGRDGSILIDSGPGAPDGSGGRALIQSLRSLGRTSIDVFVVTHADLDHRGGAIRVLETLEIEELWLPESGRGDPALESLAVVARKRGTNVLWRSAGSSPEMRGDLRIAVLWPPDDRVPRSRNAGSLVLRVELERRSFLLLADIDSAIEFELARAEPEGIRSDYLKVSHHGSRGGTSAALLDSVDARHAIVSAPCARGRGLPSAETLGRIRHSRSRMWWTGRDGAIVVFPSDLGAEGEVVSWAAPRRCPEEGLH